jgi:hypothetical protein
VIGGSSDFTPNTADTVAETHMKVCEIRKGKFFLFVE